MLNDRLIRWLSRSTFERGINSAIGMPVTLATDIGLVREENQDRVAAIRVNTMTAASRPFAVVALADGMGGMRDGAECATRTLSAFFNALIRFRQKNPKERLELAASIANMMVYEFSKGRGGATLSALLVSADQGYFTLNVGDSRIYAATAEGKVEDVIRLTVDDSLEEAVGGNGKELLQFIGMGVGLKPHINTVPQNAKRILITSDGIHFVGHESLCEVFRYTEKPSEVAERLLTLAKWRGAPDNASLAITALPELYKSLSVSDETGIEVWDSFSALHIMWLKQEQSDIPVLAENVNPNGRVFLSPDQMALSNQLPARSKPTKKSCKSKSRKGTKKPAESITSPQLTIEVISDVNKGEDKK